MKIRYEVEVAGKWYRCKKAAEVKSGWLHYELSDGTNGLARPGKWRKVAPRKSWDIFYAEKKTK